MNLARVEKRLKELVPHFLGAATTRLLVDVVVDE